ncbi:hypothetical protein ACFL29_00340 [Patescibacteria group bacterium]
MHDFLPLIGFLCLHLTRCIKLQNERYSCQCRPWFTPDRKKAGC